MTQQKKNYTQHSIHFGETVVSSEKEKGTNKEYDAPQRACYVCGKVAWRWNGEHYECGSGDQAHPEYEEFLEKLRRKR